MTYIDDMVAEQIYANAVTVTYKPMSSLVVTDTSGGTDLNTLYSFQLVAFDLQIQQKVKAMELLKQLSGVISCK